MPSHSINHFVAQADVTEAELAERARIELPRLNAILAGRWTPSPAERTRLAAALGIDADQVSWGHTMSPRQARYGQQGMEENF